MKTPKPPSKTSQKEAPNDVGILPPLSVDLCFIIQKKWTSETNLAKILDFCTAGALLQYLTCQGTIFSPLCFLLLTVHVYFRL